MLKTRRVCGKYDFNLTELESLEMCLFLPELPDLLFELPQAASSCGPTQLRAGLPVQSIRTRFLVKFHEQRVCSREQTHL
jgi:hypothetical protein